MDDFCTDHDFAVKAELFNSIFKTKYDKYSTMYEHKFSSFDNARETSMSAIAAEPGRTVGFLHDSIDGKKRLIDQVDAMLNVPPVMPMYVRSKMVDMIPVPTSLTDIRTV